MRHDLHAYVFSMREQTSWVTLIDVLLLYEMPLGINIKGVHPNKMGTMGFS